MTAVVLITGANRGLGFEIARQYSAEGWRIFAACRNPATADELGRLAQDRRGRLNVVARMRDRGRGGDFAAVRTERERLGSEGVRARRGFATATPKIFGHSAASIVSMMSALWGRLCGAPIWTAGFKLI
jgi:NAD(P)-dependent dehydrogenase (short-subunit alcohol dehydrogenase family)